MKMAAPDLAVLMKTEIPEGRKQLQESFTNLERVAQYCKDNYLQAKDKRHALEETRNFTTQSLASVAYQINTVANNFLTMLDQQTHKMQEMESSINHLSQVVTIHKEKVARREIGVLTTNKTTMRPPGIKAPGVIFPEIAERPVKYVRKSIDYSVLDHVGHGVQLASSQPQQPRGSISQQGGRRSSSISSAGSAGVPQPRQQAPPTQRPPTPPQNQRQSTSSINRGGSHYRVPNVAPVAPPSLPSNYAPNYPMSQAHLEQQKMLEANQQKIYEANRMMEQHRILEAQNQARIQQVQQQQHEFQVQRKNSQHEFEIQRKSSGSGYMHLGMRAQGPPTGVAQPMSQHPAPMIFPGGTGHRDRHLPHQTSSMDSNFEPPPPPPSMMDFDRGGNISPPLPPPPMQNLQSVQQESLYSYLPGAEYRHYADDQAPAGDAAGEAAPTRDPARPPETYLEKVIAIYDYVKDKEDELSFSENQIIYVVRKNDDGWWEGVLNGVTGLFPGNYVEPLI